MTEPCGSSVLSFTVATVKVADVAPLVKATVLLPSLAAATKSLPDASATVTLTVRSAVGAGAADTVKLAAPPSVTAVPPEMVITGRSTTSMSNASLTERPPGSVAVTFTDTSSVVDDDGVPENVRVLAVNVSHIGSALPLASFWVAV